ncbi:MAG: hypothetical protein ACJA1A_001728 [Saprospiraceae bacterium]|jgi:hypothetical protein
MKNTILTLLIMIGASESYAQDKEHVLNYLQNNVYASKSPAEFIVDNQKFQIPEGFLEDITLGFESGINKRARFGIATKGKMQTNEYDTGGKISILKKKPPHYMFVLKVLNFETIKNEEGSGGTLRFNADIKCLDLIKGTIVMQNNVKKDALFSSIHLLQHSTTTAGKIIAKVIMEATNTGIKNVFPSGNFITKLGEIKGDKVKSVNVSKHRNTMQGSPKYAYAHIVDKELEVHGKKVYTFSCVGQLHTPKEVSRSEVEFKVGDGKKEILTAFNQGKDIFVSPTQLGPAK